MQRKQGHIHFQSNTILMFSLKNQKSIFGEITQIDKFNWKKWSGLKSFQETISQEDRWPFQGQQSPPDCGEDQGDCSGLQDKARPASSANHQRCCSGVGEQRDIPWCTHLPRPVLEHQHYISSQEKPNIFAFCRNWGEQEPRPPSCTPVIEASLHWENSDQLHHRVIWRRHHLQP